MYRFAFKSIEEALLKENVLAGTVVRQLVEKYAHEDDLAHRREKVSSFL